MNPKPVRIIGIYLAALAVSLYTSWPLLAQAKPNSVTLVPLCTVTGVTHYIELPAGKPPAEENSSSHVKHCALCAVAGAAGSLVHDAYRTFDISAGTVNAAAPYTRFLQPRSLSFSPAQPRAPPAVY